MKQLLYKHKEIILYIVFGVMTTAISIIVYWFFNVKLGVDELLSNIISWIFSVLFAFVTNRIWVFESKTSGLKNYFLQMLSFYVGRLSTLAVEELILLVFIKRLSFESMAVKIVASVVVIILNYVISKLFIFRKKEH